MDKFQGKYRIKSARKEDHDYSQIGSYFVTICTKNRIKYFGSIINGKIVLSEIGKVAQKCWLEIPDHFPHVLLDVFVIMPDHVHGIIIIMRKMGNNIRNNSNTNCKNNFGPQSKNLASIIRGFKIGVKKYATKHNIDFAWLSRFHDRIIRNDREFKRIQKYIRENPKRLIGDIVPD